MNYLDQLDQMLDANFRIVSIETYDPERVTDLFTQLSRFSNKAFYMWEEEQGLHRIGARGMLRHGWARSQSESDESSEFAARRHDPLRDRRSAAWYTRMRNAELGGVLSSAKPHS